MSIGPKPYLKPQKYVKSLLFWLFLAFEAIVLPTFGVQISPKSEGFGVL